MRYDKDMKTCYAKFDVSGVFRCPLCMAPLALSGQSLLCANGHCFDVSAKGYVNLAAGRGQSVKYDKALFESRGALLRVRSRSALVRSFMRSIFRGMPSCLLRAAEAWCA